MEALEPDLTDSFHSWYALDRQNSSTIIKFPRTKLLTRETWKDLKSSYELLENWTRVSGTCAARLSTTRPAGEAIRQCYALQTKELWYSFCVWLQNESWNHFLHDKARFMLTHAWAPWADEDWGGFLPRRNTPRRASRSQPWLKKDSIHIIKPYWVSEIRCFFDRLSSA